MVWVRFSTFFSYLKLKFRKRTFINVLFSKIENRFEKTLHHHFFSVRLRHFRDLTFMLSFLFIHVVTCRPLCCGLRRRRIGGRMVRWMVRRMGKPFWGILGCVYSGDDLNKTIRWDGAESFAADGWSDGWGGRFCKFLDVYIRGMFWIFLIFGFLDFWIFLTK